MQKKHKTKHNGKGKQKQCISKAVEFIITGSEQTRNSLRVQQVIPSTYSREHCSS
jgi:hypothetical protein